mgnify:CR=1 FL=1
MFGITPPGCQCPMERTAFNAYAYHQQKVEDFINALAATEDPNDYGVQREIARSLSINMDDFTDAEIEYIEREVAKRW